MEQDLQVRIGAPTGVEISPDLWGLFFEDINNCLDGGLNAELVRNGDFEFSQLDSPGWHALTGWQFDGEGSIGLRSEDPVHPNNATYVRLVGPGTLTNEGWDPIATRPGRNFRLSLATWQVFGTGPLTARIVAGDTVLAESTVELEDRGWHWPTADLVSTAEGRGQFQIEIPQGLTVELDVISLRPLGTNGEPLTFRPDLVAALRDLHPSFIRFPGGCLAHGAGLGNMYHWKPTVGPRHTREHNRNVWGYHQSRQVGYFEYFQLCEAVGATPMPIVAAGVCCQNTRGGAIGIPMPQMPAYVQDVLDLVEFANGPVDTQWGGLRAEMGHPEPFGLRYLGIGNEDAITEDFRIRYAMIEDALREHHPEITIIGTAGPFAFGPDFEAGWQFARDRGTDIVDEHAYRSPRWFFQNIDRYADYPRQGPGVYFGEWAARSNTVQSALAEAAFMVGMERSSDVVRLASYAPLLAKNGAMQWTPDLIYFDADEVYPSASYHVQRIFAEERGEQVLGVELVGAEPQPLTLPTDAVLRLSSPGAAFSLDEIRIDGAELPPAITAEDGSGVTVATIDAGSATIELLATRTAGDKSLCIDLGDMVKGQYVQVQIPNWTGRETVINRFDDHISGDEDGPFPWRSIVPGEQLRIKVQLDGARLRAWINDELRHDFEMDLRPEHRVVVGAASRGDGSEHVVRLVNATAESRRAHISLPGGPTPVTVEGEQLAGAAPDAGAPSEPSPMHSTEFRFEGDSTALPVALPPWSFTNLVIRR